MWTCPYCREPMPVTWRRLFTWGKRRRCPHCSGISSLLLELKHRLMLGIANAAAFILVAIAYEALIRGRANSQYWRVGAIMWVTLALELPILRFVYGRYGKLVPIEGEMPMIGDETICVECGGSFKVVEMIAHEKQHVCARCKPVFLQKLAEGARIGRTVKESNAGADGKQA